MTDNHFAPLPPLEAPKPPKKTSMKSLLGIFIVAFVVLLMLLNLPTLGKAFVYPFTHSTESDNEQLTQQYRNLYGYEKHPELMAAVEASTPKANASMFPIVPTQQFEAEISIPKI